MYNFMKQREAFFIFSGGTSIDISFYLCHSEWLLFLQKQIIDIHLQRIF